MYAHLTKTGTINSNQIQVFTMNISTQSTSLWIVPISVLLLIFLISGCDQGVVPIDEDNLALSQERAEFTGSYVDGRLVFADIEAFADFMDPFIESGNLSTEELGITDEFVSLYASTRKLEEEDYERTDGDYTEMVSDFEIVEDPFFASVLNEFGEIQIGANVFKYTRNYVYKTPESNIELLKNFPMRNSDQTTFYGKYDGAKGVEILEIKRANLQATELAGKVMISGSCQVDFIKNRRLGGISWIIDWRNDYYSAGAKSRSIRKKWRKWVNNTIHEVDVSTEYTLRSSRSRGWISSSRTREGRHTSQVTVVVMSDFGLGAYIRGSMSSNHKGMRRDSNGDRRRSCQSAVSGSS